MYYWRTNYVSHTYTIINIRSTKIVMKQNQTSIYLFETNDDLLT